MKILIATGNAGKLAEIQEFLGDIEGIEFVSLKDIDYQGEDCEETGKTFAENALQKAQFFSEQTGMVTLAEDSGIIVEALKGELGIKTRRWGAGANATDEEWLEVFLERMKNEENRNAQFFCAACLFFPSLPSVIPEFGGGLKKDKYPESISTETKKDISNPLSPPYQGDKYQIFEGTCKGTVLQKSSVPLQKGIPLSALFVPTESKKVFSAMTKEEKNQISHRGNAMKQVKRFLEYISYSQKIQSWSKKKIKINSFEKRKFPKKGEVWICEFGTNIGSEQNDRRPSLIIKPPSSLKDHTCIIIPASRTIRQSSIKIENYYFLSHQIRTIDTKRLERKLERLPKEEVFHLINKLFP